MGSTSDATRVYFSHSYRDVGINRYFVEHLFQNEISLCADRKSDVWCVAKLERYLWEASGFLSVIPRRVDSSDPLAYSPFIAHELSLARRARVPRLLFIDDQVLARHREHFPDDAIPFVHDAPRADAARHSAAIATFRRTVESRASARPNYRTRKVTLVASPQKALAARASDLTDILRDAGYQVVRLRRATSLDALQDVQLLESVLSSELCVFLLAAKLSYADVLMAMAHAHCIPSIRLRFDPRAESSEPGVTGVVRWKLPEQLNREFGRQLESYRRGIVMPVEMAGLRSAIDVVSSLNQMERPTEIADQWNPEDGPALVKHVRPGLPFVQDEVNRLQLSTSPTVSAREAAMQVARSVYDNLKRYGFAYEIEPQKGLAREQAIRSPTLIEAHKTATCVDMACFFASIFEAADRDALIVIVHGANFSHALVGYRAPHEPRWQDPTIGDLRRAVSNGDAVLFEATGVLETDHPVGQESAEDRSKRVLDFMVAKEAASRMLTRADVELRHFIDVRAIRRTQSANETL